MQFAIKDTVELGALKFRTSNLSNIANYHNWLLAKFSVSDLSTSSDLLGHAIHDDMPEHAYAYLNK